MEIVIYDCAPFLGQLYLVVFRPHAIDGGTQHSVLTLDRDGEVLDRDPHVYFDDARRQLMNQLAQRICLADLPKAAVDAMCEEIRTLHQIGPASRPFGRSGAEPSADVQ